MPTLHIMLNADLEWSRGKRAAHAVHAALRAHHVVYDTPVVVLNANVAEASSLAHVVVDGDRVLSGANDPLTTDEPLVVRVVVRKTTRVMTQLWRLCELPCAHTVSRTSTSFRSRRWQRIRSRPCLVSSATRGVRNWNLEP